MKKLIVIIAVIIGIIAIVRGAMVPGVVTEYIYNLPVVGTTTNARTYKVHGYVSSVIVDFTSGCTGSVSVTSDQGTIFSKSSIAADTAFYPRIDGQTTAGAARTWTVETTGTNGPYSSTYTLAGYGQKIAVAGDVTVTVVGETATVTNNAIIKLFITKKDP